MKTSLSIEIEIASAPAHVYGHLADLSCHQKWNPHLLSISPETVMQEGMVYRTVSRVLGKEVTAENKVLQLEVNHKVVIENQTGPIRYHIQYQLEGSSSTTLTCKCEVTSNSPIFDLGRSVIEMIARDKLYSDLHALKMLVEKGS